MAPAATSWGHATVEEQRDRARSLVRALTRALNDEHGRNCRCGQPSVGDCRTAGLLVNAQRHIDLWAEEGK